MISSTYRKVHNSKLKNNATNLHLNSISVKLSSDSCGLSALTICAPR